MARPALDTGVVHLSPSRGLELVRAVNSAKIGPPRASVQKGSVQYVGRLVSSLGKLKQVSRLLISSVDMRNSDQAVSLFYDIWLSTS